MRHLKPATIPIATNLAAAVHSSSRSLHPPSPPSSTPSSPSLPYQQENYGQKDAKCEAAVKAVFLELELPARFEQYEADSYKRINALIESIPEQGEEGLKREVFRSFLGEFSLGWALSARAS